jgi:hypothetical protein
MANEHDVKINNDKMACICLVVLGIAVSMVGAYAIYDRSHPQKTIILSSDVYISIGGCFDHKTLSTIEINNRTNSHYANCADGSGFDIDRLYDEVKKMTDAH